MPTAHSPSASETSHAVRRADIQGLRGIAIGSVVLYHAAPHFLPGGFAGVDIFFVISGFLITSILARELESGSFSITRFYERRIKRLFPALFTLLAVVLSAGFVLLAPRDFAELGRTTLSTVFFVSNFEFYNLSGYFDGDAADKPLLHTWSLAVEEQFYIVFPLLLALIWKLARQRTFLVLLFLTVVTLALSTWAAYTRPEAAFYLSPFRAFELLIGASLALAPTIQMNDLWRSVMAQAGAALMLAAFVRFSSGTHWPGVAALAPCTGAALVIFARCNADGIAGRLLTAAPLTALGAISYSLYLWHWPLLSFGRHINNGALSPLQAAPLVGLAIILATLSWRFIEQPALRAQWPRARAFIAAAVIMSLTSAAAVAVMIDRGAPQRFSPQAQALFAAANDYNHRRPLCHGDEDRQIPYTQACRYGATGAPANIVVWGDSAGAELVTALGETLAARGQAAAQITYSGCPPALDYDVPTRPHCAAHNTQILHAIIADTTAATIILTANFQNTPSATRSQLYRGYRRSVERLRAAGKTVIIAYPFPDPWIIAPTLLGLHAARHQPLDSVGIPWSDYESENRDTIVFLDSLITETGAIRFGMTDALCTPAFCPAYAPGYGVLYFDGNHISVAGARLAMTRFPLNALPPPPTMTLPR